MKVHLPSKVLNMSFHLYNSSKKQAAIPSPLPKSFTLRTPPGCDAWRKPPSTNDFNAPILLRTVPLSSLRSARVTVTADWKTKFDQGGLLLVLPPHKESQDYKDRGQRRWVKTGIEFFEGTANVSTVASDRWSDWSLAPLPEDSTGKITIELSREVADGVKTSTLWVHFIDPVSGNKRPLREVAWVFEEENFERDGECEIGVYAAKPVRDEDDGEKELDVHFEDLRIEEW